MKRIWTLQEIQELPEFGVDSGWFYGLIWFEGRLHAGEIFPGMGFTTDLPYPRWDPRMWFRAVRDIWVAKPRLT